MNKLFIQVVVGIAAYVTVAAGTSHADSVFAYNKETRRISAVPATLGNRSVASLEAIVLRNIRSSRLDVQQGKVVIVWSNASNTGSRPGGGWVTLAAGKARGPAIRHAGTGRTNPFSGRPSFTKRGRQSDAENIADRFLRLDLTGSERGLLDWMIMASCRDADVTAK